MREEFTVFSTDEETLLAELEEYLLQRGSSLVNLLRRRRTDLCSLAELISRSPSMIRELGLNGEKRNICTLTQKLCRTGLEQVVNLPTRAVLGYGFTVSKMHLFGLIRKLTWKEADLLSLRERAEEVYSGILFSLMVEELYKTILSSVNENCSWSGRVAAELIRLWEYRVSPNTKSFASYVQDLWISRKRIIPILGTLQGTVELLRLSLELPEVWIDFLGQDDLMPFLLPSLEEFIFDLPYEQINCLRSMMKAEGIAAIDHQDADDFIKRSSDVDQPSYAVFKNSGKPAAVQLYKSFLLRTQNARTRRLRHDVGPHRSLEEHFFLFLLNREFL